jgi:acetoacetate decarboxylase
MKLDPEKYYVMPLAIGPITDLKHPLKLVYEHMDALNLVYRSDPDAMRELLPECFQLADDPVVSVLFIEYGGVDFMAGMGYHLASVSISARFDGTQDSVAGNYVIVMFEDDALPIILGREGSGIPKVGADIFMRQTPAGLLRGDVSLWGNQLISLELTELKEQNRLVRSQATKQINKIPMLGYKYIPTFDGPPDASYPTTLWGDSKIDRLWLGKQGSYVIGDAGTQQIGYYANLLEALKTLPVLEVVMASRMIGSSVLRTDKNKRLV